MVSPISRGTLGRLSSGTHKPLALASLGRLIFSSTPPPPPPAVQNRPQGGGKRKTNQQNLFLERNKKDEEEVMGIIEAFLQCH